jgi:predicted DCC family thiol-disulfide oxidoreductase YuxK
MLIIYEKGCCVAVSKPVLLFDGDCGFCRGWVSRLEKTTDDSVKYVAYQQSRSEYPQVTIEQCQRAVQLVDTHGSVFSGAHAVLLMMAAAKRYRRLLWLYERVPLFAAAGEWAYQLVARHRAQLSRRNGAPMCADSTGKLRH